MKANSKIILLAVLTIWGISACGKIEEHQIVGTWEVSQPMPASMVSSFVGKLPENTRASGSIKIEMHLFADGRSSEFTTISFGALREGSAVVVVGPRLEFRMESFGTWQLLPFDTLQVKSDARRAIPISESAKKLFKKRPDYKAIWEDPSGTIGGKVTNLTANEFTMESDDGGVLVYRRVDK